MTLPGYAMNQPSFPQMYETELVGPLFRPWAELTVAELHVSSGDRLLDIACGTGIVARTARPLVGDRGCVVAVDISADMLAVARAVAPDIDWRVGNAIALPLGDGEQFDVVICQQGLQFFADKQAAVGQMRRVLSAGGRLAVATWRSDDEIPFVRELRRIAERHLGPVEDQRHSFGDAASLQALLNRAGFRDVSVRAITRITRFAAEAPYLRLNAMALIGMSSAGKTMSDQERKRIVEAIVIESQELHDRYSDGSTLAFELTTNLAVAKG